MKHFIFKLTSLIIVLSFIIGSCGLAFSSTNLIDCYSVEYDGISYTYNDMNILIELMDKQKSTMDAAHQMAEGARKLGYAPNHPVITLAGQEWQDANFLYEEYKKIYDNLKENWTKKEQEYPEATFVWSYLKNLGYSDYVCAGILGNIMTEVGGSTLAIQPTIYGNGYYGMCQWNKVYSEIWGASLEAQCDYLRDTIINEFDLFGSSYKRNFTYDDFLSIEDVKEAALAFAKIYERCGSGSYKARKENAVVAYNYFVG